MKKKNILNLIRYHAEKNESAFLAEAHEIASDFDATGDYQLAEHILALLSSANTFTPQTIAPSSEFFKKLEYSNHSLPLPEIITEDIIGIVHAVRHNVGVNKFLFQGPPGTGKTESAKQLARILDRELYVVDFDTLIDSKLGQTSKNMAALFDELQTFPCPDRIIVLFDEIDAIAIDRINSNDLREMGRATSSMLKQLEQMNPNIVLIATTNLFDSFDKALIRRFDSVIDFSRYTSDDLLEIAESILNGLLPKFNFAARNMRLFRKIVQLMDPIPYPADLQNLIKTSLAFSIATNEYDYLKRLFYALPNKDCFLNDMKLLKSHGFTVREIEILSGVSKSRVARDLKEYSCE